MGSREIVKLQTGQTLKGYITDLCNKKCRDDETPFYLVNMGDIRRKCDVMAEELPNVQPHYAVKCNYDVNVLQYFAERGLSFDCASQAEIKMVLGLGVSPDRIIFANTFKCISDLRYAEKCGVHLMTFDSEDEIKKVKEYSPNAKLVIRIKGPDLVNNDNGKIMCHLGEKYGCDTEEVESLLSSCQRLEIKVVGVSFHVGTRCKIEDLWSLAIAKARRVFDIAEVMGIHMTLLDIGGGYPGLTDDLDKVRRICQNIRQSLDEHFPASMGVRIISEPGTFFVASAFTLVSRIISKKTTKNVPSKQILDEVSGLYHDEISQSMLSKEVNDVRMYVLNVGVFNAFFGHTIYNDEHKPILVKEPDSNHESQPSILWGPTCDTFDRILKGIVCLPDLQVGDWLYFENLGDYISVVACNFNGVGLPVTMYVDV